MLKPFLNTRSDEGYRFLGIPTLTRATGDMTDGALAMIEHWDMPVGFGSPYHTHRREDESFYVLEGKVAFVCDGEWLEAGPGDFVYGPRDIPHGFQVVGDSPARMLVMCTPAGFETFILDQATPLGVPAGPPDMGKLMELAERHGIEIHGPLPERG
jgi:quercetin dioxygenase-like cupin family protein